MNSFVRTINAGPKGKSRAAVHWRRYQFIFAVLVATSVVAAVAYRLRPMSLLVRATRIVSLRDPHDRPDQEGSIVYRWMDAHRLVLLRYPAAGSVTAERLDLSTGKRTPAKDIADLIDPINAIPIFSPDGAWFLLTASSDEKATKDRLFWKALSVDKKNYFEWFPEDPKAVMGMGYETFWLPDSRHIAEFYAPRPPGPNASYRVNIRDIRTNKYLAASFRYPGWTPNPGGQADAPQLLPGNRPLLVRINNSSAPGVDRHTVTFSEWASNSENNPPHTWTVAAPSDTYVGSVVVSPQGDRVGWAFVRDHPYPLLALFDRLLFRNHAAVEHHMTLAVSSLDGSNMRMLGELDLPSNQNPPMGTAPWDTLEWTPGCDRLAFTYQDTLYTVPIGIAGLP